MEPIVAIKGFTFRTPTMIPFEAPHRIANMQHERIDHPIGSTFFVIYACMIAQKANTLPTDRSKFAVTIRRFAAEATIISGAI
jgi:hypothetical protein